ncbi:MAG: hypothetical protein ABIR77_05990 [Sphingomicrobium sp.]
MNQAGRAIIVVATGLALVGAAPRTLFARDGWAAFERGASCEATARAERVAMNRDDQARIAFTFDRGGPRRGQLAAHLGRPVRNGETVLLSVGDQPFLLVAQDRFAWSRGPAQEAAIIAAARVAPAMRIEAWSPGVGRFVDRYLLSGAAGSIDAAAACSARR